MVNLPVKGTEERIVCTLKTGVSSTWFDIRNSNGYAIEELHLNDPDHLARLLTEARNQGFAQGQKHVRSALGI